MNRRSAAFLLLVTSICFSAGEKHTSKLDQFSWLLGSWQMQKKSGIVSESWKQSNDSTFDGNSNLIKTTGEKMMLESIQLVFRGQQFFYIPTTANQNNQQPVNFIITSHSNESFTAENPAHNFPKRIIYTLINKDSLHATIDGGPAMPQKKSIFSYSRGHYTVNN